MLYIVDIFFTLIWIIQMQCSSLHIIMTCMHTCGVLMCYPNLYTTCVTKTSNSAVLHWTKVALASGARWFRNSIWMVVVIVCSIYDTAIKLIEGTTTVFDYTRKPHWLPVQSNAAIEYIFTFSFQIHIIVTQCQQRCGSWAIILRSNAM